MAIRFAKANFSLVRGTKWEDDVILEDSVTGLAVNLTGITGMLMRIRKTISSAILLELSVSNGRLIVVDAVAGRIGFRVLSAITLTLPENSFKRAKYVYDAIIQRTALEYEPAVGGKVTVLPQVTRAQGST